MVLKIASLSLALILLAGCTNGPTINIGTKQPLKVDPLKVDLNMRVDVYQHADATVQKRVASTQPPGPKMCRRACAIAWAKSRC